MPKKSTKKAKEKLQDFQKKKLKVGKGPVKADSFTDTSFSSKSIIIPNQCINEDKSMEITNSKNQTLQDIMFQIKHYSAHTRKDAINGLSDMLHKHPEVYNSSILNVIIHAVSKRFVDDDRTVRKVLAEFCSEFFSTMSTEQMKPFISIIMAYVSSAMNHIYEDIRIDGLNFLDVFVKNFPDLIQDYAEKIIPNFISLITTNYGQEKKGQTELRSVVVNPSSLIGSVQSRLHALQSFYQFIFQLLRRRESEYWYLEGYGVMVSSLIPNEENVSTFDSAFKLLKPTDNEIPFTAAMFSHATTKDITLAAENRIKIGIVHSTKTTTAKQDIKNQYHLDQINELESLISIMMPVMIDFWIEAYPLGFPVGFVTLSSNLLILDTVIKFLNLIWRTYFILYKTAEKKDINLISKFFKLMDKHVTTHFPFGHGAQLSRDGKLDALLQQMNIQYSEVLCHFLVMDIKDINNTISKKRMFDYVETLFNGEKRADHKQEIPTMILLLKFENLKAAYPMVWKSIENGTDHERVTIIKALLTYFDKQPIQDGAKYNLFSFLSRLICLLHHPQYSGINFLACTALQTQLKIWIQDLPKLLWNLKATHEPFARDILILMSNVLKLNLFSVCNDDEWINQFIKKYTTVFTVDTPKTGVLYGPFVTYSRTCQLLAIDLLYYIPSVDLFLIKSISVVLCASFIPRQLVSHFLDVLSTKCPLQSYMDGDYDLEKNSSVYFSALFTLTMYGCSSVECAFISKKQSENRMTIQDLFNIKREFETTCSKQSVKRKRTDGDVDLETFVRKMESLAEFLMTKLGNLNSTHRQIVEANFKRKLSQLEESNKTIPIMFNEDRLR